MIHLHVLMHTELEDYIMRFKCLLEMKFGRTVGNVPLERIADV